MTENMKKFLELVSKDETLKQKAQAINDMEPAEATRAGIALAKELGIELTEADFAKEKSAGELSDDELDAVAGGGGTYFCVLLGVATNWFCPIGGAGIDIDDRF